MECCVQITAHGKRDLIDQLKAHSFSRYFIETHIAPISTHVKCWPVQVVIAYDDMGAWTHRVIFSLTSIDGLCTRQSVLIRGLFVDKEFDIDSVI